MRVLRNNYASFVKRGGRAALVRRRRDDSGRTDRQPPFARRVENRSDDLGMLARRSFSGRTIERAARPGRRFARVAQGSTYRFRRGEACLASPRTLGYAARSTPSADSPR